MRRAAQAYQMQQLRIRSNVPPDLFAFPVRLAV